jgi:capsular polysaccharide export protein
MRAFCQPLAEELRFVRKLPETLADDEQVLVWGSRHPERQNAIRVEDGFIRSGAGLKPVPPFVALHRPVGIYFDSRRPSGLEQLLNQQSLPTRSWLAARRWWICSASMG